MILEESFKIHHNICLFIIFVFYKTDAHSISFISWIQAKIAFNFFFIRPLHCGCLSWNTFFSDNGTCTIFWHSPIVRMREWRHWPAFSQLKTVITNEANFATLANLLCITYMSKVCCVLLCRDALNFTENWQKSNGVFLGKSNRFKIMVNSKWYFKIGQKYNFYWLSVLKNDLINNDNKSKGNIIRFLTSP